jgi:lysophospholipase L1-like esterase
MAILRQKKILNVIPGTAPQLTVHCSQDDAGSEVAFDLYAGSAPFEPQDAAISVQGVRKDGTGFGPVACTYEGNVVTVTLDATMTGVAGPAVCELTITEEGGTVSTANFALLVEAAAFPHGPIVDDSVDVYQQILAYVQGFAASAAADATEKVAEEATARAAADAEMQGQISAETAARSAADGLLQTEIDQIIAPTGEAPSAAEVQNARIGEDGTVYDTLGNAIRGQVGDLKSAINEIDAEVFDKTYVNIAQKVNDSNYPLGWKLGKFHSDGTYVNQPDGIRNTKAMDLTGYGELILSVPNSVYIAYILEYTNATINSTNFSRVVFSSQTAKKTTFTPAIGKYYAIGIEGMADFSEVYDDETFVGQIKLFEQESNIPDKDTYFNEKISFEPFVETNNQFLTNTGEIASAGSVQYNIAKCAVSAGDILVISGSNTYYNAIFAFFDSEMTLITVGTYSTTGSSTITNVENFRIKAPTNSAYVVVNYMRQGVYASIKKVVGSKIKGVFLGKKWCCVGDSLTEKNTASSVHYYDYIAEKTDIVPVVMGVGGSGYARKADTDEAFYQRVANVPTDSDVITIFGSFNDLGSGLDLGTVNDTGTTTIAGCINTTIDTIQARIPLANIGVVAPTPWDTTRPTTSGNAYYYVEMLKAICARRSIPFLDLWRESNLRPWDADFRAVAYSKDNGSGTHPDENGHKLIAPHFEAFLDTLLLH